ncbi:hypothetical protein D9757_002057 [Collybiopsis confluens]|uniref:CS domain-containing protein n=1 Tax=Collybiopsis confluens TaxID=2823264 RepID=A0A8H5HXW5_9AGAR|nr:hypothetical protein D9757_002057 [Collybiopsis confluens]
MITPRFTCSQTAESVIISIYCPSTRASDVEINVDGTLFSLHINPYFLRLNFTNALIEDDASSAQYDPSTGYLTVTLSKEIKGQEFKDLDLLAKLLAPRPTVQEPLFEVIASQSTAEDPDSLVSRAQNLSLYDKEISEAAENDWQLPQQVPPPEQPTLSVRAHYGFLDMHSGYFTNIVYTENEINELGAQIENLTPSERRQRRIQREDEKWDEEYYMADFADDDNIQELIQWTNPRVSDPDSFSFTDKENMMMLDMPRKECKPSIFQTVLLFAYAYDARTTRLDPTPESAWTICSLTPCFSALDPPPYDTEIKLSTLQLSVDEVSASLVPSYRRSLAFPLYRSYALAEKCRDDVANILLKGKRTIFRCLLEMKDILDNHEVYYVYSKIWLGDFCVWTQANARLVEHSTISSDTVNVFASNDILIQLGINVKDTLISKDSLGWDIEQLEAIVSQSQDNARREEDSDDE